MVYWKETILEDLKVKNKTLSSVCSTQKQEAYNTVSIIQEQQINNFTQIY